MGRVAPTATSLVKSIFLLVSVAYQAPVNRVGQASFEASDGFFVAIPACAFGQVVGPAGAVALDLGDGRGAQAAVELAVPGRGRVGDVRRTSPEDTTIGAVPM